MDVNPQSPQGYKNKTLCVQRLALLWKDNKKVPDIQKTKPSNGSDSACGFSLKSTKLETTLFN